MSKRYTTIVVIVPLTIVGAIVAFITGWIVIVPIVFGVGIPLVNLERPPMKKIALVVLITFINLIVFLLEVLVLLNLPYDKYVFPTIAEGIAGVLVLVVNGLFIKSITINWKTSVFIFLLSALAIPLSLGLIETFIVNSSLSSVLQDFFKQFGGMILWVIFTTLGVVYSMKTPNKDLQLDSLKKD